MKRSLAPRAAAILVLSVLVLFGLASAMTLPVTAAKPPAAPPGKPPAAPPGRPAGQVDVDKLDAALGQKLFPLAFARGGGEVRLGGSEGRYLRAAFDDLARSARKQRKLDYRLHVLSSRDRVDAWAFPDGSVFVTLGLVDRVFDPDELAGVLAHQLAHAILRHNLDDLTSPEEQALLREVAGSKKPVTRDQLGRAGISILGEYYPTDEERAADRLAGDLLRLNGFREGVLEVSFRRLVEKPLPGYLMVHPHPDLKPLPPEPAGPSVIIVQPAPPAPPFRPAPVPGPRYEPDPAPRFTRPATPASRMALSLVAGRYPLSVEASSATVTFKDDHGGSFPVTLETRATGGGPAAGAMLEVPFSPHWEGLVGGGWTGTKVFTGRPMGNGGFVLAGVLRRGSVDGKGVRWAVGPYLGVTWLTANAGQASDELYFDELPYYDAIEAGSDISATASSLAAGGLFTLAGDTPAAGISWFVALAAQVSTQGDWSFSSKTAYGESVDLPFDGEGPAPLSTAGAMALGGVVFRF